MSLQIPDLTPPPPNTHTHTHTHTNARMGQDAGAPSGWTTMQPGAKLPSAETAQKIVGCTSCITGVHCLAKILCVHVHGCGCVHAFVFGADVIRDVSDVTQGTHQAWR